MRKIATLPAIRVEPALREAVENVLAENETLSSFAEQAIRAQVERRQIEAEFVKRALASRDKALETGVYVSAEEVHGKLRGMLEAAKVRKS